MPQEFADIGFEEWMHMHIRDAGKEPIMNLFVDDERLPINATFQRANTYTQAIQLLSTQSFTMVSLDYDLQEAHTGMDILHYMCEHHIYPKQVNIHSTHTTGSVEMYRYAKAHLPAFVQVTFQIVKEGAFHSIL